MDATCDNTIECLQQLFQQQTKLYGTMDYLAVVKATTVVQTSDRIGNQWIDKESLLEDRSWMMKEDDRCYLANWAFQVVDHKGIPRRVATIAMNFFDRYLISRPVIVHQHQAIRLLQVTSLFLAVKLGYHGVSAERFSQLTSGTFSAQDIVVMEEDLLTTLHWAVHPPIAEDFLHFYMRVLVKSYPTQSYQDVLDVANYIVDNAALDYFFVRHKPSVIAMAAFMHAVVASGKPCLVKNPVVELHLRTGVLLHPVELNECRDRITVLVDDSVYNKFNRMVSPTSVRES